MTKGLVSIVIPVYNVEQFLQDCFDSLDNQTYKNVEIIFVNDGSTDNSKKLIEQYCAKHPNSKLINQENKGLPTARAAGIAIAKGEFLFNYDPDDIIHPEIIQIFVDEMNRTNADFVSGYNKKCRESKTYNSARWNSIKNVKSKIVEKENLIDFISGKSIGTGWSVLVKLYRFSTLKQIPEFPQITPNYFSRGEDLVFNAKLIKYCNKAVVVDHVLHLWRQRHTSLTHTKKFNTKDLNVLYALDPYMNGSNLSAEEEKALLGNKAYQASMLLCVMKKSKYYEWEEVEKTYRIYKENLKYCMSIKHHSPKYLFTPLHCIYWIGFVWKAKRINKH